ncbi:DUF935 family protein [Tenacibaculum maritimum]|nr:DUF935 family protein [Tenacibaculum maritimum]MDB0611262.1 DUF935 family protein [Tenacibaculum maritimum]
MAGKKNNKKSRRKNSKIKREFSGSVTSSAGLSSMVAKKSVSQARKDIGDWNKSQKMTGLIDNPKWYLQQQLYTNIFKDALLTSQYKNRTLKALAEPPVLYNPSGEIDEAQTDFIQNALFTNTINGHVLDSIYRRVSLIEFKLTPEGVLKVELIPRENIDPNGGFLYPDYSEDKKINYRELKEFGTWVLEFGEKGDLGLFNQAVPHVLFKRFAQSCHSELCEIYGIPPRVMKTNTQDPAAMTRGKKMMQDMGSAAWFIIDEDESFEFAKGVSTSGDVYKNLMNICNNEISLLINGAVIGQDTKNGSRSKDESSREMLGVLIDNDLQYIKRYWNSTIIPALKAIGVLSGEVTYGYEPAENIEQLWKMTKEILPYKNIDDSWLKEKFGIEVTGDRAGKSDEKNQNLQNGESFFV